jgi:mono/diheme cytochrome c family protein
MGEPLVRSTAIAWRRTIVLPLLSTCCLVFTQVRAAQAPNQGQPNPQDRAVKVAGQSASTDASGRPLDEQKSAPVQVIPREYDLEKLTHEPKVSETVFRGRVLWVQKCAFCHDGFGTPTYKTMGPWIDQDMVNTLTPDVTKIIIQSGTARMPAFKDGLSAAQLDDLMNFLKTVPASAAPTPAQLAGRSDGGNSD